ncbi:MAG: glycosyltransferase family 4 protein [Streptococcaceae bacterium]|jgi:1,2-diacylglycerol-3-alpha-glucose alpha-1,2-galactosyltransferase|nr:glycosyltransferase family 4 protein [Streptococcaceae bacterium]
MLKIVMYSSADKVAGQGVGSAYLELMKLLKERNSKTLELSVNSFKKADISHYHTIDFPFYLTTFFKKTGRKIGYVHFIPETLDGSIRLPKFAFHIFKKYVMHFYGKMDHLVVVNPEFKLKLIELGIPEEKITFIPNFISKENFFVETEEVIRKNRKQYGLSDEDFVVLGAGQVQKRKGIDDFFQLAVENPQIKFIWAGGFSFSLITDGYEKYKEMMANPPKNLIFTGIIDRSELQHLYNLADVFLLPSFSELMPMSILEAANTETPILLRDLELYEDIFFDGYAKAGGQKEMGDELLKMKANPEYLGELSEKSRSISLAYSEERLSQVWEDFYKEQSMK